MGALNTGMREAGDVVSMLARCSEDELREMWGSARGEMERLRVEMGWIEQALAAAAGRQRASDIELVANALKECLAAREMRSLERAIAAARWTGRPGYPIRSMVGIALLRSAGKLHVSEAMRVVADHRPIRAALGIEGDPPSAYACYRFEAKIRGKRLLAADDALYVGLRERLRAAGLGRLEPLASAPSERPATEVEVLRDAGGVRVGPLTLAVDDDCDADVEALRARYLEAGSWRGGGLLTARQRDILGVLRVADEPLSARMLYYVFDCLPRTWSGSDPTGLSEALKLCAARGLVERVTLRESRRGVSKNAPMYGWRLLPDARRAEPMRRFDGDRPIKLAGVGLKTGRVYRRRRRRPWLRDASVCEFCHVSFRTVEVRAFCSQDCERAAADGELRALVAAQERDAAVGDYAKYHGGLVSMDEHVHARGDPYGMGVPRLELFEDWSGDPATGVERADAEERRRAVIGGLTEQHVGRLNEYTLEHLRDRLSDEGLTPHSVQRAERERLRQPARHRGGGPPPTFQPIHSKRRSRQQQIALMSGGRIARKQRRATRRELRELDEWD